MAAVPSIALKYLPHFPGERGGSERLLEVRCPRVQDAVLEDRVVRVSGHEEDLQCRPELPDPLGDLTAAPAGENHVREEEIDLRAMLLGNQERLPPFCASRTT